MIKKMEYKTFIADYWKYTRNKLEILIKKGNKTFTHISNNLENEDDTSILKDNSVISSLWYDLTQFNMNIDSKIEFFENILHEENKRICIDNEESNAKSFEQFTYPKPNIDKLNDFGTCFVTHIKDNKEKLIYITQGENSTLLKSYIKQIFLNEPEKFQCIPKEGEIFGIYVNNHLYRAVRENDSDLNPSKGSFKIFLIDTGEIIEIGTKKELYKLPNECKNFPSQAILCKIKTLYMNNNDSLNNLLHAEYGFFVHQKDKEMLYINLFDKSDTFANHFSSKTLDSSKKELNSTASIKENLTCIPLKTLESHKINNNTSLNNYNDEKMSSPKNVNLNDFYSSVLKKSNKQNEYLIDKKISVEESKADLSTESLEINKINSNTEPSEIKGIDTDTESAEIDFNIEFAGAKKVENSNDRFEPIFDIKSKFTLPKVNDEILLVPVHITNYNSFFAHHQNLNSYYKTRLSEMIEDMNTTAAVNSYEMISRPLVCNELVLALYKDENWYRARIIGVFDEDHVEVIYLDFGNTTNINRKFIRKWEPKYSDIPYQAIPCRINGLNNKTLSREAMTKLENILLNHTFQAKVVEIEKNNILIVDLFNLNDKSQSIVDFLKLLAK